MEDLWIIFNKKLYDKKSKLPKIMNDVAKSQNIKSKELFILHIKLFQVLVKMLWMNYLSILKKYMKMSLKNL